MSEFEDAGFERDREEEFFANERRIDRGGFNRYVVTISHCRVQRILVLAKNRREAESRAFDEDELSEVMDDSNWQPNNEPEVIVEEDNEPPYNDGFTKCTVCDKTLNNLGKEPFCSKECRDFYLQDRFGSDADGMA